MSVIRNLKDFHGKNFFQNILFFQLIREKYSLDAKQDAAEIVEKWKGLVAERRKKKGNTVL